MRGHLENPLLFLLIACIAGLSHKGEQGGFIIACVCIALLCLLVWKRERRDWVKKGLPVLIVLLFLFSTLQCMVWEKRYNQDPLIVGLGTEVLMQGRIVTKEERDYGYRVTLDRVVLINEGRASRGRLQVFVDANQILSPGMIIQVQGTLELPPQASNPGTLDLRNHLKGQGIYAWVFVVGGDMEVLASPLAPLLALRSFLADHIKQYLPPSTRGLALALLLGERGDIKEEEALFREAGLSHIVAISGLHVGFIAFLIWSSLGVLPLPRICRFAGFILAILLFMAITGGRPPVLRAGFFAIISSVGVWFGGRCPPLNTLALIALGILLINPHALWGVGFQLSFTIAFFLILGQPLLSRWSQGSYIRGMLGVSILATLAASPLTAYHFQTINPLNCLGNFWAIPLTGAAVLTGVLGFVPLIGPMILQGFTHPILLFLQEGLQHWNLLPTTMYVAPPHFLEVMSLYGLLWVLLYGLKRTQLPLFRKWKGKLSLYLMCFFLLILLVFPLSQLFIDKPLKVTILDVGQGDALHLSLPGGENYLIDGGGRPGPRGEEVGHYVLLPYLRSMGVNELDGVFITHFHMDHYRGLLPVFREMEVGFVGGPPLFGLSREEEVLRILEANNIPYLALGRGWQYQPSDVCSLTVLHPGTQPIIPSMLNNNSLVKLLQYHSWRVLFTGDLEREGEQHLIEEGLLTSVHVLKVGHHGSRTSTTQAFLDIVQPHMAVIPVGDNTFGHPAEEVLERLFRKRVKVFSTREHGAVMFRLYEDRIEVETYKEYERGWASLVS